MAVIDDPYAWGYTWNDKSGSYVCPACAAAVPVGEILIPWKNEKQEGWKIHMTWHRGLGMFSNHYWPITPKEQDWQPQ